MIGGRRKAGIIRLDSIRSACHLYPHFGEVRDLSWTSSNILEKCTKFYVNHYLSNYFFQALSVPLLSHTELTSEAGSDDSTLGDDNE
jgi:hypothetical protein